jgi:glycosyltransferase involved in cell wall biosynthesis
MNRIRVCIVVDDLGPDAGTERQIAETVRRLNAERFETHLCCFAESTRLRDLSAYAVSAVFPLRSVGSPEGMWQILRFRSYLRKNRIDVAHAWMVKSAIFTVAAALGTPCRTITSRLNTGYWYTPTYLRLFRVLNRCTTRVFANSQAAKKIAVVAEGLQPSKVDVIYNGVDAVRYSPGAGNPAVAADLGVPPDTVVVGIVANLRPVKDVELFVRMAAIVARRVPHVSFIIVGQGPLREELEQLAHELGLNGKLFFASGRGTVPDYLSRMSVACLCSRSEGFSNAILEYMAVGLPVVATDVGGNAEAVVQGVTGYVVTDRSPEAFAEPVIRLLESDELRSALGMRALELCRERFSIETYTQCMQNYYAAVAANTL